MPDLIVGVSHFLFGHYIIAVFAVFQRSPLKSFHIPSATEVPVLQYIIDPYSCRGSLLQHEQT
jgi:hypothetical protein